MKQIAEAIKEQEAE